jgi:hypothetical protein
MENVIFKDESYRMMGACFGVYRDKGCGFLKAVLGSFVCFVVKS